MSGDVHSAIADLAELQGKRPGQEAVKRAVVLALEMKDSQASMSQSSNYIGSLFSEHSRALTFENLWQKERASVLLSAMTRVYGSEQFFEGFIRVLKSIDDLALDTPDVVPVVANFIARAMVDDVLPPSFIGLLPQRLVASSPRARQVVAAVQQLVEKGGVQSMVHSWGAASKSSVAELKASVKTLVDEYFVEREVQEAVRCVRELDAPHFGHEVVKRIVFGAVERGEKHFACATLLLKALLADPVALESSQLTKVALFLSPPPPTHTGLAPSSSSSAAESAIRERDGKREREREGERARAREGDGARCAGTHACGCATGAHAEEHAGKARDGASHKRVSHTRGASASACILCISYVMHIMYLNRGWCERCWGCAT